MFCFFTFSRSIAPTSHLEIWHNLQSLWVYLVPSDQARADSGPEYSLSTFSPIRSGYGPLVLPRPWVRVWKHFLKVFFFFFSHNLCLCSFKFTAAVVVEENVVFNISGAQWFWLVNSPGHVTLYLVCPESKYITWPSVCECDGLRSEAVHVSASSACFGTRWCAAPARGEKFT